MPYIKPVDRAKFDTAIEKIISLPYTSGELNYILTRITHGYLAQYDRLGDCGLNYGAINSAIGALECCKLEQYRRIAAPYEDNKIQENGDVPS